MGGVASRCREIIARVGRGPCRGVEVGVYTGRLSAALLRANEHMHLTMVDSWAAPEDQPESYRSTPDKRSRASAADQSRFMAEAERATAFARQRRTILHMPSAEAVHRVRNGSLTFAFIDADHSHAGCAADIEAWLPRVAPGGWLGGHDYDEAWPGVIRAVDEAVERHGWRLVLGGATCWWVQPGAR